MAVSQGDTTHRYEIKAKQPFELICSDIYGPTLIGKRKIYLITIIDVYTRYTKVYKLLKEISDKEIVKCFSLWNKEFRHPSYIITDNGTQYTSKNVKKFATKLGINLIHVPKYHPQSNGICERTNSIISEIIRLYRTESIGSILKNIEIRLNQNYRRSVNSAPAELVFGKNYYDLEGKINFKQNKRKNIQRERPRINSKICVGSTVYIKNYLGKKWEDVFKGPYVVEKISNSGRWLKVKKIKEWIYISDVKF